MDCSWIHGQDDRNAVSLFLLGYLCVYLSLLISRFLLYLGTEHARQWLQNRLSCSNLFTQVGLISTPSRRGNSKAVITPETIPDFVIPTTRKSNPLPSFKKSQANSQSLLSVNSSQSTHSSVTGYKSCGDLRTSVRKT